MGQSATETVREIERTRARLSDELDELEDRLPAAATMAKRVARIAAGSGVGGTVLWIAVRRIRKRRAPEPAANQNGAHLTVSLVPEGVAETLRDDRARAWILGAAAVWLWVRLSELRHLRKLRKAMLKT